MGPRRRRNGKNVKSQPSKPNREEHQDGGWLRHSPSQVRPLTVAVVILTAVVVLSGLYLLWQLRHIVVWFVIALFLVAALDPAVNWLQRRHIKRSIAILLTYVGLLAAVAGLVALVLPLLFTEIRELIDFITRLAQHPGGWIGSLDDLANRYGLGHLVDTLGEQLSELPERLAQLVEGFLLSAGGLFVGVTDFVVAFITILVIAFFLLLEGERFVNGGLQLFDESQRPRVRRILNRSARAVSGYITGNLTISFICGVGVYIVLLLLGMPYATALALIVAVLDLIPYIGALLGGALLVIVSLFIDPFDSLVLLVYFVVYKLVEDYVLTPVVYSRSVHLHPLAIFIAILAGGVLYGVLGALLAIPIAEIIRILGGEWLATRAQQSRESSM
jgi:predicted PurR-regulated permease PerM